MEVERRRENGWRRRETGWRRRNGWRLVIVKQASKQASRRPNAVQVAGEGRMIVQNKEEDVLMLWAKEERLEKNWKTS